MLQIAEPVSSTGGQDPERDHNVDAGIVANHLAVPISQGVACEI